MSWTSYRRRDRRRDYLETPGPKQRLVLEALALAKMGDRYFLTPKQLADSTRMPQSSVAGCTSGMMNMHNRQWIRMVGDGWAITIDGMAALLKLVRLDEGEQ